MATAPSSALLLAAAQASGALFYREWGDAACVSAMVTPAALPPTSEEQLNDDDAAASEAGRSECASTFVAPPMRNLPARSRGAPKVQAIRAPPSQPTPVCNLAQLAGKSALPTADGTAARD